MILTCDTEVTTWNKGNPFDSRNFLCANGWKWDGLKTNTDKNISEPFKSATFNAALIVLFNAKFDYHWYRLSGVNLVGKRIWCCQLAEYYLSGQTEAWPSLENTAVKYGLGHKIDVVKNEYWEKGINTNDIPWEILSSYLAQDCDLTYQVYLKQLAQFQANPQLFKLFLLACEDIHCLAEMEWNGEKLDINLCTSYAQSTKEKISAILTPLHNIYPTLSINFNSGDQLSAFLYGGDIIQETKEHVGFYKTGVKAGEPKFKNVEVVHKLPRLIEPIKGTELKKPGYFKTDVKTLQKLKGKTAKQFVGPLLELSRLEKLNSTYYVGLPAKLEEMHWQNGLVHGQLNQCVTQTGRLSSSNPNKQNFATECLDIFISRY